MDGGRFRNYIENVKIIIIGRKSVQKMVQKMVQKRNT